MSKQGKKKKIKHKNKETLNGLFSREDIEFLQKLFETSEVVSFCYWMEENLLSALLPKFSSKKFIETINHNGIDFKYFPITTKKTYSFEKIMGDVLQVLGDKKDSFLSTWVDFLYSRDVLIFYRKMTEIFSPVLEFDIISVSKSLDKKSLNNELKRKLEALVRKEFSYWAEKFVTSWYENIPHSNDLNIYGVPVGPIVEYDLMIDVILGISETTYWKTGDGNEL